ncbi:MAG: DUF763 domain-containing protein [Caldisericaceae bacterium]
MKTGFVDLPLHRGSAPPWLFSRMKLLAREIILSILINFDREELYLRLSDPVWFQSFGCVLGFDWHSSGLTTVTTGAIKEGLREESSHIGIFFAGGKGKSSLNTPMDIENSFEKGFIGYDYKEELKKTSRLVAKVDSNAVQSGYKLYHHFMIYDKDKNWVIIQQGMKGNSVYARRYHWSSYGLESFVKDPHKGVIASRKESPLNLVDSSIDFTRSQIVNLANEDAKLVARELKTIKLPQHHPLFPSDFNVNYIEKVMKKANEENPKDFEKLLLVRGLGEKTLRALALLANLTYGGELSFKDPANFSFAHGGKDGYPFPVERDTYDKSIEVFRVAINHARIGDLEKFNALRRLKEL